MLLITGSTSLVGRLVVQALSDAGTPCRALMRSGSLVPSETGPEVARITGDVTDARVQDAALEGVRTMVLVSRAHPDLLTRERLLLQAAARHRVPRVVKLSVADAAPDAALRSSRWHWAAEQAVRAQDAIACIVRTQRPLQHLCTQIDALLSQHQFIGCQGVGRTADVDARDIADVLVRLAHGPADPLSTDPSGCMQLEVTGGEAVSADDVARALSAALGHAVTYVDGAPAEYARALVAGGLPPWQADDRAAWQSMVRLRGLLPPTDAVSRVLGRPPRTLAAFADEFAASVRFSRGLQPHSHAAAAASAIARMRATAHGAPAQPAPT